MNIKKYHLLILSGVVMDWNPRYFSEIISMTAKKWNISWEISLPNEWNAEQDRGRSVAELNALAYF